MPTRSGCVAMDSVMESAAITQKRAVASNNAPADEPKSRGHNPDRSKQMLWIGAIAYSGSALYVGTFAERTMCATDTQWAKPPISSISLPFTALRKGEHQDKGNRVSQREFIEQD